MKKVEKSIDEMMLSLTEIDTNQMGVLHGGFTDLEVMPNEELNNFICFNSGNCVENCKGTIVVPGE
ncbi:MAG: hypothetical protein WBB45_02670 [Cyclobacteriaceae bacterium]